MANLAYNNAISPGGNTSFGFQGLLQRQEHRADADLHGHLTGGRHLRKGRRTRQASILPGSSPWTIAVDHRYERAQRPAPGYAPARENQMMHSFASYDGTELHYRVLGDGPPLVCLPGGPGRAVEYLGDLGGLAASRQLVLLDPRGVGQSPDPADPESLRADRLVHDVESLRVHLGLERVDLLAHSAASILATLYAAAHPQHLSSLVLVTPGLGGVGVFGVGEQFDAVLGHLAAEPWYPAAYAALEKILTGDLSTESFAASRPLFYARWDDAARAHATVGVEERHMAARTGYFDGAVIDPAATRTALAKLTAPVLLYVGDLDPMVTPAMAREAAPLFPSATVVVQPGAGHYPWVDDPAGFSAAVGSFLA